MNKNVWRIRITGSVTRYSPYELYEVELPTTRVDSVLLFRKREEYYGELWETQEKKASLEEEILNAYSRAGKKEVYLPLKKYRDVLIEYLFFRLLWLTSDMAYKFQDVEGISIFTEETWEEIPEEIRKIILEDEKFVDMFNETILLHDLLKKLMELSVTPTMIMFRREYMEVYFYFCFPFVVLHAIEPENERIEIFTAPNENYDVLAMRIIRNILLTEYRRDFEISEITIDEIEKTVTIT